MLGLLHGIIYGGTLLYLLSLFPSVADYRVRGMLIQIDDGAVKFLFVFIAA